MKLPFGDWILDTGKREKPKGNRQRFYTLPGEWGQRFIAEAEMTLRR